MKWGDVKKGTILDGTYLWGETYVYKIKDPFESYPITRRDRKNKFDPSSWSIEYLPLELIE